VYARGNHRRERLNGSSLLQYQKLFDEHRIELDVVRDLAERELQELGEAST
jgi:hypothetical protein